MTTEHQLDWIGAAETPAIEIVSPDWKPGLYTDLSNEDYHGSSPISSSGLKRILRSPSHFKNPKQHSQTRAMEIGTAIHTLILEPHRFHSDYKIVECDARTSALYKAACKDHPSERVLTIGEYENVKGMQDGVMRNRGCRELIEAPGRYELSLFAKDPETGLIVKVRYDKLTDSGMPVDLKKTQDARPDAFSRSINMYDYHLSAALYMDAWSWAFGEDLHSFRWIAVEEQSPHAAKRYVIDDLSLEVGRAKYREALIEYDRCLQSGVWPSYDDGDEEEIGLPGWAIGDYEESLEVEFD